MVVSPTITEEIAELKRSRKAVILAHHYQDAEIQELADAVGDSLELARQARDFAGEVIAFCGVWFMAETAKVLNPERVVVVPDETLGAVWWIAVRWSRFASLEAGSSGIRGGLLYQYFGRGEGGERYSVHFAECGEDCQFDSGGAAGDVFAGFNLGNYVREQTGRENMKIWQGACIVHATFRGPEASGGAGGTSCKRWWRRIRSVLAMCWRWRILSGRLRRLSIGARTRMRRSLSS